MVFLFYIILYKMKQVNKKFFKSNVKNKKYRVEFMYNGKLHKVNFGDKRYEQFKDSTPLKLYNHLDHNNKERRKNYRARASRIKNKKGELTYKNPLYPNYWSYKYLW